LCRLVRHHHERSDGNGYPDGLANEEIPRFSKLIALCDSFEAVTGGRCYSKPKEIGATQEEILVNLGKQFDRELGSIFIDFVSSIAP
jgi:HD-GYP domain-containing protein (c-di-GMP phosphodiesterase class II)